MYQILYFTGKVLSESAYQSMKLAGQGHINFHDDSGDFEDYSHLLWNHEQFRWTISFFFQKKPPFFPKAKSFLYLKYHSRFLFSSVCFIYFFSALHKERVRITIHFIEYCVIPLNLRTFWPGHVNYPRCSYIRFCFQSINRLHDGMMNL